MPDKTENKDIDFQPPVKSYAYSNSNSVPNTPANQGTQNSNNNSGEKKSNIFTTLVFSILGFLFLFFIFLVVLNYFNVLSLSKLYPSTFGFLPHQTFSKIPVPNVQLTNSPTPIAYSPMPILNQADKTQILGYLKTVNAGNIPTDSVEAPNEFYGIFSGYDNTHIQLVTRKGVKNFPLASNLQISSQASTSAQTTESASTETKTLSFNTIDKNTLFNNSRFGKILHVTLSTDSKSIQSIFLNE